MRSEGKVLCWARADVHERTMGYVKPRVRDGRIPSAAGTAQHGEFKRVYGHGHKDA